MGLPNALDSLHNGELSGKREQLIHTPANYLAAVAELWPEGIALDACGSDDPACLVVADRVAMYAPHRWDTDICECGLCVEWPERTFLNPEYETLWRWLAKYNGEGPEVLLLGPVRSHRRWWRYSAFRQTSIICWHDPLTFVGYDSVFPAPLMTFYRRRRIVKFIEAFKVLGDFSCERE